MSLSGCASVQGLWAEDRTLTQLGYLSKAQGSDAAARESLWKAARAEPQNPDAQLRVALLQSLPGHSGFNPGLAETRLAALAGDASPPRIALIARTRLHELRSSNACRGEVADLRRQLEAVVEIERDFKSEGD